MLLNYNFRSSHTLRGREELHSNTRRVNENDDCIYAYNTYNTLILEVPNATKTPLNY